MAGHDEGEMGTLRPTEAGCRSATPGEGPERSRAEPAAPGRFSAAPADRSLDALSERIGALERRLGDEVAKLRETTETHVLHLLGRAIEALSSLERDWVRARSEADSWREKLREATLGTGELQRQLDRIGDLRRAREAEAAALRDELQRELAESRQELARAREAQHVANQQRDAAERECRELQQRISWRVTSPLRYVRSLFPKAHG